MYMSEEMFNDFLTKIADDSFKDNSIDLSHVGLNDSEIQRLMTVINANVEFSRNLTSIDLAYNELMVPPDISKLFNLKHIFLQNNLLLVPPKILTLDRLEGLGMVRNNLTYVGMLCLKAMKRTGLTIGSASDPIGLIADEKLSNELLDEHLSKVCDNYWCTLGTPLDLEETAIDLKDYINNNNPSKSQLFDKIINDFLITDNPSEGLEVYVNNNIDLVLEILQSKTGFSDEIQLICEFKQNIAHKLRNIMELYIGPILFAIGSAYEDENNFEKAREYYKIVSEEPYNYDDSLYQYALMHWKLEDFTNAKILFLKSARLGNDSAREVITRCIDVEDVPREILDIIKCAVSLDAIVNPATTPSGYSYELKNIQECAQAEGDKIDPLNRQPLDIPAGSGNVSLIVNKTLEGFIDYIVLSDEYPGDYPGFKKDGKFFDEPFLNLDGNTVEKNAADKTLRPDFVLRDLLNYFKHGKVAPSDKAKFNNDSY